MIAVKTIFYYFFFEIQSFLRILILLYPYLAEVKIVVTIDDETVTRLLIMVLPHKYVLSFSLRYSGIILTILYIENLQ